MKKKPGKQFLEYMVDIRAGYQYSTSSPAGHTATLYFPVPQKSNCGHVTCSRQWHMRRSNLCHFWAGVHKRQDTTCSVPVPCHLISIWQGSVSQGPWMRMICAELRQTCSVSRNKPLLVQATEICRLWLHHNLAYSDCYRVSNIWPRTDFHIQIGKDEKYSWFFLSLPPRNWG